MRRKGEVRISTKLRGYRFVAQFKWRYPPPVGGRAAEHRAAELISGGDFFARAPIDPEVGIEYRFKSGAEAHAMQMWFEAHGEPYDPWEDRRRSYEASRRTMKAMDDLVNAAAAVGAPERLRAAWRSGGPRAARELLQQLADRIDAMEADRVIGFLVGR